MLCFERMVRMSVGCVFVFVCFFLFLRHTACAGPQLVPNKAAETSKAGLADTALA